MAFIDSPEGIFADLGSGFPELFPSFSKPNGADYATGWDLCKLADVKLPGIAEVTGPGLRLRRDPNSAPGKHGGEPVYKGLESTDFTIKVIIWTQSQLALLLTLQPKILPVPGVKPKPVPIDHPFLYPLNVRSVTIVGVSPLQWYSGPRVHRGLSLTITASHWLGDAKDAKKNNTVQPKRGHSTTRPDTPPPAPTSQAGVCGAPNHS